MREGRVVHGTHIKQAGGGVQYAGKMAELVDLFPPRDPHASAPGQAPPLQSLPSSVTLPSEFRVWEFIGRGWDVVKPHWLIFTGMFFILMAIEGVPYLGPLASFIIGGALMVGVWRAILGAIGGRKPDIGMMFQGFDRFGDAFLAQLIRGILIFLGFLCLIVPVIILGIMLHGFDRFGQQPCLQDDRLLDQFGHADHDRRTFQLHRGLRRHRDHQLNPRQQQHDVEARHRHAHSVQHE